MIFTMASQRLFAQLLCRQGLHFYNLWLYLILPTFVQTRLTSLQSISYPPNFIADKAYVFTIYILSAQFFADKAYVFTMYILSAQFLCRQGLCLYNLYLIHSTKPYMLATNKETVSDWADKQNLFVRTMVPRVNRFNC